MAEEVYQVLQQCFGVSDIGDLDFEAIKGLDQSYGECMEASGLVTYELGGFPTRVVAAGSPCDNNWREPSANCCAAIEKASACQVGSNSQLSPECSDMLQEVVLDTYRCQVGFPWFTCFFGVGVLFCILLAVCMRHWPVGALLRKNFLLWKQGWIKSIVAQLFEVSVVGILAFVIVEFTSMAENYLPTTSLLGFDLTLVTPDENRLLIYQNLRPFGGIFL